MSRVFLGMPSYGTETCGAGMAYWRASNKHVVRHAQEHGSLLARNFNRLWCQMLDTLGTESQFDYFAMIHDDIAAEPGWVDKLIDEMEANGLTVLSAVVPIKTDDGISSTAVDGSTTWRPARRITMTEAHDLPATFTADDVGGPLLLNTGCWVARVGEWCRKVHFTINDRIVQSPDGKYHAEVEPEDWFFSRLLNEIGVKIGATTKIRLHHDGSKSYPNTYPWGKPYDSALADGPVVPPSEFRFPHDVQGWLSYAEGRALYDLARNKSVLEIGSYCGKSTVCIAQSARRVMCIDPFDGRATPAPGSTYETFVGSLAKYGVNDRVSVSVGTRNEYTNQRIDPYGDEDLEREYDLVFVDGAHDYYNVAADIEFAEHVLNPGGIICFHDYRLSPHEGGRGWDPGVTEAVNDYLARGATLISRHDTLAVTRPKQKELAHA